MAVNWWDNYENIVTTAYYMAENGYPPREIVYMMEKPHKFDEEYETAQAELEVEE